MPHRTRRSRAAAATPSATLVPPSSTAAACRPPFLLLGAALVVLPFVLWPGGSLDPTGHLRWPLVFAAIGVFVVLAFRLPSEPSHSPRPLSYRAVLAEPFIGIAAIAASAILLSALASPAPLLGFRYALREWAFIAFACVLARLRPRPAELRFFLAALCLVTAAQAALTLLQAAFPGPLFALLRYGRPPSTLRASMLGTFGNPEVAASFLAIGGAAAAALFAAGRSPLAVPPRLRRLAAATFLLAALSIILSGGRGAFLGLLASLPVAWLIHRRTAAAAPAPRRGRALAIAAAALLLLATLLLAVRPPQPGQGLPARLAELADRSAPSVRHRLGLIAISWQMILDRPLSGTGPGRWGAAYGDTLARLALAPGGDAYWQFADDTSALFPEQAHCDYLQWGSEYGLPALAGLLGLILAALTAGLRPPLAPSAPLAAALVALAVTMAVGYPLRDPVRALIFWSLLGLLAGAPRPPRAAHSTPEAL